MVSLVKIGERTSGHRIAFSGGGILGQNSFAKPEAIKGEPSINNVSIGQEGVMSNEGQRLPCKSHMADISIYLFKFNSDHCSFLFFVFFLRSFFWELDTTIILM